GEVVVTGGWRSRGLECGLHAPGRSPPSGLARAPAVVPCGVILSLLRPPQAFGRYFLSDLLIFHDIVQRSGLLGFLEEPAGAASFSETVAVITTGGKFRRRPN